MSVGRADGVGARHVHECRWRLGVGRCCVDAIEAMVQVSKGKGRRNTNRAMPPGHSRALNAGFDSSYSSRDIAMGFARVACSLGGAGAVQGLEATTGTPTQPPASPRILWSNSLALKSVQTSSFFWGGGGFWRRFLVASAGDAGCVSVWRLLVRGAGSLRQRDGTAASAFASRSARGGEAGSRKATVWRRDAPNVKGLAIVGPRLMAGAGFDC